MIKGSRKTRMDSMIIQKKYLPETAGGKVRCLELVARFKTREYDDSNRNEDLADSNEYFQNR